MLNFSKMLFLLLRGSVLICKPGYSRLVERYLFNLNFGTVLTTAIISSRMVSSSQTKSESPGPRSKNPILEFQNLTPRTSCTTPSTIYLRSSQKARIGNL